MAISFLIELIFRSIPEIFMLVLAVHALNRVKITKIRYIQASLILLVSTYFIRILPINFGVHFVLNMIVLIFLTVLLCKMNLYTTIKATIIITITLIALESLNILAIVLIMGESHVEALNNPILKTFLGLPAIAVFSIIVIITYKIRTRNIRINEEKQIA